MLVPWLLLLRYTIYFQPLLCGSTTLAYSEADCPLSVLQTTTTPPMPHVHSVDQFAGKTNPYKEHKKSRF